MWPCRWSYWTCGSGPLRTEVSKRNIPICSGKNRFQVYLALAIQKCFEYRSRIQMDFRYHWLAKSCQLPEGPFSICIRFTCFRGLSWNTGIQCQEPLGRGAMGKGPKAPCPGNGPLRWESLSNGGFAAEIYRSGLSRNEHETFTSFKK